MKARLFDDHCGECPLIDYCGDPYEDPYFCQDENYREKDHKEIIKECEEKPKMKTEDWNKLTSREKLIHAGHSEKQLDEMLKEYPDDDPEEIYENELHEMASNAEWED